MLFSFGCLCTYIYRCMAEAGDKQWVAYTPHSTPPTPKQAAVHPPAGAARARVPLHPRPPFGAAAPPAIGRSGPPPKVVAGVVIFFRLFWGGRGGWVGVGDAPAAARARGRGCVCIWGSRRGEKGNEMKWIPPQSQDKKTTKEKPSKKPTDASCLVCGVVVPVHIRSFFLFFPPCFGPYSPPPAPPIPPPPPHKNTTRRRPKANGRPKNTQKRARGASPKGPPFHHHAPRTASKSPCGLFRWLLAAPAVRRDTRFFCSSRRRRFAFTAAPLPPSLSFVVVVFGCCVVVVGAPTCRPLSCSRLSRALST